MHTYLYLKVTNDRYELPEAVAASVDELSRMTGNTKGTISSSVSRQSGRFRKVEIVEDDE